MDIDWENWVILISNGLIWSQESTCLIERNIVHLLKLPHLLEIDGWKFAFGVDGLIFDLESVDIE